MKMIKNFKLRRQLQEQEEVHGLYSSCVQSQTLRKNPVLTTAAIISALIATLFPFYSYKRTSEPKLYTHCKNEIHLTPNKLSGPPRKYL